MHDNLTRRRRVDNTPATCTIRSYARFVLVFTPREHPKWGYHLLGLKAGLEGGQASPFPDDLKLSANWP